MNKIDLDSIEIKAKKILSEVFEIDADLLPKDADIMKIENWDSLNQIKIAFTLEKEIGRELSTNEILSLTSIKNIVSILETNGSISKVCKIFILTKKKFFDWFLDINDENLILCSELSQILSHNNNNNALITCNTNKIIPEEVFKNFSIAINIHPGSFEHPGRDPHHWACYNNSSFYGATAHILEKKVDTGKIIDQELEEVKKKNCPSNYLSVANKCTKIILKRTIEKLLDNNYSLKSQSTDWIGKTKKRKDLIAMCDFKNLSIKEIEKRKISFQGFEKFFIYY